MHIEKRADQAMAATERQLELYDGPVASNREQRRVVRRSSRSIVPLCAACRMKRARYGFRDEEGNSPPRTLCFECFRMEIERRLRVAGSSWKEYLAMTRSAGEVYRPDPDIFVDAKKALEDRPSVPPEVHVHVEYGNVTLTGSVRWPFERAEAEDAVRHVEGIRRLVNRITVAKVANREGFEPPDDRG